MQTNDCWFSEHVIRNYSLSMDGLLKVNNDHIGFYRVNHDNHMWNDISQQLQNNHTVNLSSEMCTRYPAYCLFKFSCVFVIKVIKLQGESAKICKWNLIHPLLIFSWNINLINYYFILLIYQMFLFYSCSI